MLLAILQNGGKQMKRRCLLLLILLAVLLSGCTRSTDKITSAEDVNQSSFKLGVIVGAASNFVAEKQFPQADLQLFSTVVDAMAAVKANKIDGFFFDTRMLGMYCAADDEITTLNETFTCTGAAFGLSKNKTQLRDDINAVLARMRADGTLEEVINRWCTSDDPTLPDLTPPENPTGTLCVLVDGLTKPFNYIVEDGKCVGLDIEITQRIAYALNMNWELRMMNFDAMIPTVAGSDENLIISFISVTEERKKEIAFTDEYYTSEATILVRKDRYVQADESEDAEKGNLWTQITDNFTGTFITEKRWKLFLSGIGVTVLISVCAYMLGTVLGLGLCLMLDAKSKILNKIASLYGKIVTGIPILVWLMILYYMVFKGVDIPGIAVAIIGFGLATGASLSGIFKTGLDSVSLGQREAAQAMGFSPFAIFRHIIFPQAAHHVFDLYSGVFVSLAKSTSIVGYIAIMDLTKVSDIVRSRTYKAFFPLIATALIYFGITCAFIALLKLLQRKLNSRARQALLKGVTKR